MKDTFKVTGKICIIKRLASSEVGNPRYLVSIGLENYRYEAKTMVDSSIGYLVKNFEGKLAHVKLGYHYNQLSIANLSHVGV